MYLLYVLFVRAYEHFVFNIGLYKCANVTCYGLLCTQDVYNERKKKKKSFIICIFLYAPIERKGNIYKIPIKKKATRVYSYFEKMCI